jgi:hypothetical protein
MIKTMLNLSTEYQRLRFGAEPEADNKCRSIFIRENCGAPPQQVERLVLAVRFQQAPRLVCWWRTLRVPPTNRITSESEQEAGGLGRIHFTQALLYKDLGAPCIAHRKYHLFVARFPM